MYYTCVLTCVK